MDKNTPVEPVWCVVANVVYERDYRPGGVEKRSGTKHFAPGAKVYLVHFYWGMGAERVIVVGRHRKSHRYITIVERSEWLANWRAELVYSPYVLRQFEQRSNTFVEQVDGQVVFASIWDGSEKGKKRAEENWLSGKIVKARNPSPLSLVLRTLPRSRKSSQEMSSNRLRSLLWSSIA